MTSSDECDRHTLKTFFKSGFFVRLYCNQSQKVLLQDQYFKDEVITRHDACKRIEKPLTMYSQFSSNRTPTGVSFSVRISKCPIQGVEYQRKIVQCFCQKTYCFF